MLICGGDEAGRGALVGPLVVALVVCKKDLERKLSEIGVRDSKLLTRGKRAELYTKIGRLAVEVKYDKIRPQEINEAMRDHISLNELEAIHFSRLFDQVKSDVRKLYLDSPDVIAEKFAVRVNIQSKRPTKVIGIKSEMKRGIKYTKIIAEHKADSRYPVVSAASIIAKVVRDSEVKRIERALKFKIGSGYPSDKKTIDTVFKHINDPALKAHLREHWKTMGRIRQTRLPTFSRD
jgi:ribonuclease HII